MSTIETSFLEKEKKQFSSVLLLYQNKPYWIHDEDVTHQWHWFLKLLLIEPVPKRKAFKWVVSLACVSNCSDVLADGPCDSMNPSIPHILLRRKVFPQVYSFMLIIKSPNPKRTQKAIHHRPQTPSSENPQNLIKSFGPWKVIIT